MTERDAFGNPIGPTTTTTTTTSAPSSATAAPPRPAPATEPARTAAPAPAPGLTPLALGAIPVLPSYGPSKTTWWERLAGFAVFLVFAAPLAIGGYVAYTTLHTAKDAVQSVSIKSNVRAQATAPAAGRAGTGAAPAAPRANLLNAKSLRGALAAVRRDPGGRLTLLRVAPDRVNVQLARKGGGLSLVQLGADGGRSVVQAPGTPNRTIGFARVDVQAPARLVHRAAHRLGRSTKAIDYVVLVSFPGTGPQWSAYFKGGAAFQGDAHGRILRRLS